MWDIVLIGGGIALMSLAIALEGFFKIIIWAGSCVAMYYGMQMSGWIGDETPLAQGLFFIGLLHTALTVFEVKFLGVVIFRGISDLFVHTAGIIMIIAGIVMMVA